MVSGKLTLVRVRVWFRIIVRIRAVGQFSSGAILLEPLILEVSFLHILYEFHEINLNVMKYIYISTVSGSFFANVLIL